MPTEFQSALDAITEHPLHTKSVLHALHYGRTPHHFFRDHITALEDKVKKLLEYVEAVNSAFCIRERYVAGGCEHGFKPAKSCRNERCEDAKLHRLYCEIEALVKAGEK